MVNLGGFRIQVRVLDAMPGSSPRTGRPEVRLKVSPVGGEGAAWASITDIDWGKNVNDLVAGVI